MKENKQKTKPKQKKPKTYGQLIFFLTNSVSIVIKCRCNICGSEILFKHSWSILILLSNQLFGYWRQFSHFINIIADIPKESF